jgi:AcrR family transcriptional regulator
MSAGQARREVPGGRLPGPAGRGAPGGRPPGSVQPVSRASERGIATRNALLAAAREVFTTVGYAQAGVTDIVNRAGASVGSLYHHFSGKAELYLALFEDLNNEQAERTRRAVREIRDAGVTDPKQLFLVGAREYLDVCAEQSELLRLFVSGDSPPGFDLVRRQRLADWVSMNTEFFVRSGEPLDEAVAIVMTGALSLCAAELSLSSDAARTRKIADGVIEVLSRLESPRD